MPRRVVERLLRRLRKEARDLWTWQEGRSLRQLSRGGNHRGTLLVVTNSNQPSGTKVFALLAKCLQLEGFDPIVVTAPQAHRSIKAYRAFGIERFALLDVEHVARRPLGEIGELSEARLLDLRYRGVSIGRTVLNTVVRRYRLGSLDFAQSPIHNEATELLEKSAGLVDELYTLVGSLSPTLALFQSDRGYSPVGEAFGVCLNLEIPVVPVGHSQRRDAFVLKRYSRVNEHSSPYSLSDESWQHVLEEPWTSEKDRELMALFHEAYDSGSWYGHLYRRNDARMPSREGIRGRFAIAPDRKLGVIFPHVLWDAAFFFGESLFSNYEDWLLETLRASAEAPGIDWIVRLHPAYVSQRGPGLEQDPDLKQFWSRLGELPANVHLVPPESTLSAFALMKAADVCVTVQGTVGIEAPCHGVPVLTAGTGRYSGRGFTIDSATRDEYLARIRSAGSLGPLDEHAVGLARRFAHAVFKRRLWVFSSFEIRRSPAQPGKLPPLRSMRLKLPSHRHPRSATDLRKFVAWIAQSDSEDYLEELD